MDDQKRDRSEVSPPVPPPASAAFVTKSGSELSHSGRNSRSPRVALVVLGMHRSGTSALARVLNLLGCDLPKTLMACAESNVTGHWESQIITDFDDALLESAGSGWDDWAVFNPGWYHSPKADEFKERAQKLLEEEFGASRLFVLKDPRMCRILPFWLDVLDAAKIKPAIVIPIRNPLEVASSLAARDGFDPEFGHLLWLRHVLEAESASRGRQRFFCSYEGLISARSRFVLSVQDALDVSFPRMSVRVNDEIDAFVSKQHHHHRFQSESVAENFALSSWLRDAYGIFERWAKNGERSEDFVVLDRVRAAFDDAVPSFRKIVAQGRRSAHKEREQEQKAHHLAEENIAAQQKLIENDRALLQLSAERDELSRTVKGASAELLSAQARLEIAEADADRVQELQRAADMERERLAASEREVEALRLNLLDIKTKLDERFNEISILTQMLRDKEGALSGCRAEKEALAQEVQTTRSTQKYSEQRNTELQRHLIEMQTQLVANENSLNLMQDQYKQAEVQLSARFDEIATLMRLLRESENIAYRSVAEAEWARKLAAVYVGDSRIGRLIGLLPGMFAHTFRKIQLKRRRLFDADAYLKAHPDVARAGADALRHYLTHGLKEGRARGA